VHLNVLSKAEQSFAAGATHRYRDQAARELRRLGKRPPGPRRPELGSNGVDVLSGPERAAADPGAWANPTSSSPAPSTWTRGSVLIRHLQNNAPEYRAAWLGRRARSADPGAEKGVDGARGRPSLAAMSHRVPKSSAPLLLEGVRS
jgi:hypothetical protein